MLNNLTLGGAIKIGGPVVYFLILCSMVSVAVIMERLFFYYAQSRVRRGDLMERIKEQFRTGNLQKALAVCEGVRTPFARVLTVGIKAQHLDEKDITDALEREMIIEANNLERRIVIVGTIGSTAVYIGLLGTVWGIIKTFRDISTHGSGGLNVVIGGISEALVCTAAGLFVAIPAVMAYNYFVKRISKFVTDMELSASEIVSLIRAQKRSGNHEKNIQDAGYPR